MQVDFYFAFKYNDQILLDCEVINAEFKPITGRCYALPTHALVANHSAGGALTELTANQLTEQGEREPGRFTTHSELE